MRYSFGSKLFVCSLVLLIVSGNVKSQQLTQVSQFMFNQLIYNPAAAGMNETKFNANFVGRFQWSSIDGAPLSNFFWTDYKFSEKNMALGLNVNYEKFGANKNTDAFANFSYHLPLSRKLKLCMGLRAGATFSSFNTGNLTNVWDQDDPVVNAANRNEVLPKIGAGFQLLSKNLYLGIALPDFYVSDKNDITGNKDKSFFNKRRNYLLTGGYKFKINDSYGLFPNVRVVYYPGSKTRVDMNLIAEITDYFWAGATYSTIKSYTLMAGTHISSRIRFGYAYEFMSKKDASVRLNTHEINLMVNMDGLFRRK